MLWLPGRKILTRALPKTGQSTEYVSGDDGTYQAGWRSFAAKSANPPRFIQKTLSGDDVVIDLATGLMWPGDHDEAGTFSDGVKAWSAALTWAVALTFAGFSDWRLPNIFELITILDYGELNNKWPSAFTNTHNDNRWSSTTYVQDDTKAFKVSGFSGSVYDDDKVDDNNVIAVRTHLHV